MNADLAEKTIIDPALAKLFGNSWASCRVIFFSAPFGMGKTTAAHALLPTKKVAAFNAENTAFLDEPVPADCDAILIDDFQMLNEESRRQALCGWIRENPTVHFVLLGRGVVPGWLMPFQIAGLMTVIGPQQLQLGREATRRFLEQNNVVTSDSELAAIMRDVQGYAVALALLVRHMAGGVPYSAAVFDEMQRDLFHAMEDAVFHRFPEALRQLLLSLAPFESFDSELAQLASGDSHVNDSLAIILHETTMLRQNGTEHYRFWPVFRRFLLWEMAQCCTIEEQHAIYSRAGLYYELHEDYAHALESYSKSGEVGKVSCLLIKNAERHPGTAHYYEMEQYYYAVPRDEILRSPTLMSGMSMLSALNLDFDGSERWYAELQNYAARLAKTDDNYREAKSRLTYLDIALPQRGSDGLIELIGTVFRAVTDRNLKVPAFSVTSTLPSIMNGGKDFCGWSKRDDLLYATMRRALETVLGKDGVGLADCAICESKFEKGEDVSARVLTLMADMSEIQHKGTPDIAFATMGLVIRVQMMQGKAASALKALEGIRESFAQNGDMRFLPNMDAMRCRIWLRLGMQEKADGWLQEKAPSVTPHFRAIWRYRYMTRAMVQIARGAPEDALLCLAPLVPYCKRCGRIMDGLYLHILMAICYGRLKNEQWKSELRAALDLSEEYRFITPIAQYGAAVLPLLTACGWKKGPAFFEQLLAAVREQTVNYPDFLRPAATVAEPLTPAELQVLKLLCHNRSNQEIADVLGVKLTTVKSQVRSILQKLNVKRRAEAKAAAETLHLV